MKTLTAKHAPYVNVSGKQAFSKRTRNLTINAKLIYILMLIGLRQSKISCGVFCNVYPQTIKRICRSLTADDIAAAMDEIKQAELIEYDEESGDLHVRDWWINNLIEQNPSHLVNFQKAVDLLDMSDHFRELAEKDLEKVQDRYNNRHSSKDGQYKAISDLVYAAKIQPEFIWQPDFVKMPVYEQLTYLTVYIGAVRDAKVTGCYTAMDEYAIADIIGGDANPDEILAAIGSLKSKDLIMYDAGTGDLVVPAFLSQNIFASSFATYKMWMDLIGEVQLTNTDMIECVQKALANAQDEMFTSHEGIKIQMQTAGCKETVGNKVITYKLDANMQLYTTEEIVQRKSKTAETVKEDSKEENKTEELPKIARMTSNDCMSDLIGNPASNRTAATYNATVASDSDDSDVNLEVIENFKRNLEERERRALKKQQKIEEESVEEEYNRYLEAECHRELFNTEFPYAGMEDYVDLYEAEEQEDSENDEEEWTYADDEEWANRPHEYTKEELDAIDREYLGF